MVGTWGGLKEFISKTWEVEDEGKLGSLAQTNERENYLHILTIQQMKWQAGGLMCHLTQCFWQKIHILIS